MSGDQAQPCPKCGHRWAAHHRSRIYATRGDCLYRPYAGYSCPCQERNPRDATEDAYAREVWRMYMGRT